MSKRVEGRSYGQRVPPLTSVIKSILERYPDGGQILKEIIQNADDASATTISFLLDSRGSPYGKSSLYNDKLAKFQGPALYSFNNARFEQEDWDGLQSLMDSNKKEEPLKVGRFGIGFNSIYHVTDLPSVVSGDLLAFLDPHEVYFGKKETGRQFELRQPLIHDYKDQFSPFEDVLGCKISSQFVNGTLFRFPLRTEASELSKKPYTTDKVRHLFQSLKDEASLILLFLKKIEEINLYETDENQREKLVFSVRLHDCCRERVREQRKNLLLQVPEWESGRQTVLQLDLEMVIEIFDTTTGTKQEKWITHNRIGDKQAKMRERALSLHLLPWVGFAAPVSVAGGCSIGSDGGRIFCFLPLPPDADAKTGYPVHIHGYFGLTDNRRGLKWPGPECQNDDMAEWNVDLMWYVGSQAYASLLQSMTTCLPVSPDMISIFYQCWPDKQYVNKHWKEIIDNVYNLLLSESVFWTRSYGGRWLSLNQAVFERLRCKKLSAVTKTVVKKVLHLANEPVVSLPLHIDEYVGKKMPRTRLVTPTYLRTILKQNRKGSWDMQKMSREERISMLEYIVTDNNFADFEGIALLPLADGRFITFKAGQRCDPNDVVYVETTENRMTLLPGTESRFLDTNIKQNVLLPIAGTAVDANKLHQSYFQLVRLNPRSVISLLRQVLPKNMFLSDPVVWNPSRGNHPSEAWLVQFWKWLVRAFPYDLTLLEGFPLIKCSSGQHTALAKLKSDTKTIRQKSNETGMPLPQDVVSLLKKAGVVVLPEVPRYMMQHACFSMYVADASPEGVLKVLRNIGIQRSIAAVTASNAQEIRSLRELLSSLRANLSNDERQFLKSLPIFEAIDQTSFIDAQDKSSTAPRGFAREITLKIKNASCILSVEDDASNKLLNVLNIPKMTIAQFLTREVFPHLSCYTTQEVTSLMCWVLRRIDVFKDEPKFCSHLSSLNFVDAGQGSLAKPQDLFDPRNELNKRLLEGEESKFPVGEFAKEDVLVPLRNHLGLKKTLNYVDVAILAMNLHSFHINHRRNKAIALLEFLGNNPSFLRENLNYCDKTMMLQDFLRDVAWVPCAVCPPRWYPKCMSWKSVGNRMLKPDEVVASKYGVVVGSVMSVLQSESTSLIKSVFGWEKPPDGSKVLEQLRVACNEIYVKSLQGNEREQFWRMLKSIYETLAVNDYCYNLFQADFAWIWNGQGFSSPSKIAFRRQTNFDLDPYLHTIPKEMQEEVLCDFFPKFGVKACFTDEDLLDVLLDIKAKHDNAKLERDVIAKDKQLAIDILHWIVRKGPMNPDLRDKVYVPVMKGPGILNLVPLTECTFCDAAWLRGNFLELQMLPELSDLSMIDESISNTTASHLGVPPMSRCVTSPEALGFEQAGPCEPITRRLKNILDEYKEGAGVFKELIQNADDAGATEVKFLVDWRQHPAKKLLAEGMKESQGPALLAYNNAVFTKKDFENINKLAGATKKEDLDKIGRFGLGFNSVYHFTDTPSFVSSNYAVFFDPDTKHLGHFITNPLHPGIKLNLAVNRNTFLCYPDQFQPYQGVFECDVKSDMPFNFDGTLFRFPFRRGPSEICDKQYNEHDVNALLESFNRSASSLLLNTQNVQHVSVWELDHRAKEPSDVKLLTKVERKILSDSGGSNMTTFLHECATWSSKRDEHLPQRTKIISITHTITEDEKKARTEYWLQCDRMGDAESLKMAKSKEGRQEGLLSCAGVAVNLNDSRGTWKIKRTDGEAFCFLPLSIPTGLPVHVNGYFAVTSNRRGIWEQTAEESQSFQPVEARWNKALMKDGIAQAYVELLKETKRMAQEGDLQEYNFCSLWPNPDCLQSQVWNSLIVGVYALISSSSMKLLKCGKEWHSVSECFFRDDEVKKIPGVLDILYGSNIVDIPKFARNGFRAAGCGDEIDKRTLTQEKFLTQVFFPYIEKINEALRNKVVCYVIDECLSSSNSEKKTLFQKLLSTNACIPCSADQQVLARPRDLIHPRAAAASLYSPCDNKIPVGDCFLEPKRLLELENCGMTTDVLNWDQILERAKSVQTLDYVDGLKRISALVQYLNQVIDQMPLCTNEMSNGIATLPVFPIMAKPERYMFPWQGDMFDSQTMLSSSQLFGQEYANVIGSLRPVLDESEETGCGLLDPQVRRLFRLSDRTPSLEDAINQLEIVCQHFPKSKTTIGRVPLFPLNNLCSDIYKFLHTFVGKEEEATLIARLEGLSWILVEDYFVKSAELAFKWNGNGAPYLYRVPRSLANSQLLVAAGVKTTFDVSDFLSALNHMKAAKKEERLDDDEFKVSKVFLDELNGILRKIPNVAVGCTPMPDRDRVLRPARELVINDTPWMVMDKEVKYVHGDISINLAHALGAQDIRSKNLEDISRSIGHAFGQKELLTDRLANILKSYPCDFGILKELLQNADDAKATEIHFVYDPRQHGKERLFNDSWKELQGPALCVYNNRPFSEKDLEGIQRLGIGSKADSPEKTGQYGIGFNAVYHLTDCPSFITDGNTLCILDPHARYAPGATKDNPGRLIGPFEKTDKFEENYRDVLPGYLGDMFDLKGSTMFRFPLRNKEMAKKTLISKEVIESIDLLLQNFQTEAKEALLFLNNVKKISVSTISENRLELNYQVSAILEEQDEQKRRELAAHMRESKGLATQEIKKIEVTYPVTLREKSTEEKWIVQQTVGVDKNSSIEIPDGRQNGLLPRAGVAAKVTTYNNFGKERLESTSSGPDKRKAFCFLPLPVITGLPVHVNGHFALDSGRRHLWQDEDGSGFRTKWNNFMKTEVIADAYVSLLIEARKHVPHLKDGPVSPYFSTVRESNLGLEWYQKLFPSKSKAETQWGSVVSAVLNKIARQDVPVFPVVRQEGNGKKMKHPCNWLSSSNGFFTSLECSFRLEGILRSIGFNLLSLNHRVFRNFKEVDAPVTEVTPEEVISFLSTHNPILRQLPCPLQQSSIGTVTRYIEVLLYCMKSTSFAERLDGVPLLLTKDGFLRLFSKIKPVFLSAFHHLVPSSKHFEKFSIKELTEALEYQCDDLFKQQNQVVVPMKLADLATFLPFLFKEHKPWNTTSTPVLWDPDNHDQELAKWLIELWDFITTEYSKNPSDDFLEPLKSWPVFPITARQLVPVSLSKTILDLTEQDSWAPTQKLLVGVLRKLQCPEVDMKLLKSKAASVPAVVKSYLTHSEVDMSQITSKVANISAVFKPYLAYPNSIDDVIIVLDYLVERDRDISGRITAKEAELLLQFLQEDSETLVANTKNVSVLRKLPFFKTIDGRLINLEGASAVCKVPQGIPLEESHVWMGATNYVFLEPCHSLDVIHQMLGVQLKSQTSCYIDFIFPVFSHLKVSSRIMHLSFIIDVLLYDPKNNEANQLNMALNNLAFIPNEATGLLCRASDFYDHTNQVFKALLTTDKFPGKPFDSPEWIRFLQDIGLLQTLSQAQVLRFAKEIENQAVSGVTKQLLDRSTVLTQYLLQETSLHEANFLQIISSVHFVVAHRVDKRLTSVLKQFSSDKDKSGCLTCFRDAVREEYEQLVWSSAALLPAWAVSYDEQIRKHLGILQEPSLNQVVVHAYNICTKFSKSTDVDLETSLRALLLEIMEEIYKYLQRSSFEFHDTYLQRLSKMPLALVENGGVFIQCKQMVFEMQEFEEQPPYLYRVPRSYGRFEGLFKKLGTTEKPMPLQYANILEEIWNGCKENTMHKEEMRLAKQATSGFFRALKRLHFEDQRTRHKTTCAESLKDVLVIYFPSQKGKLRPSNQLFHMYDCPQLLERVKAMKSNFELMIELSDIGFRYDHPEELLSYLPQHLKVNSITKVLKEELHPECLDKKCRLDGDDECTEASRLREILGSQQFTDGLVRIFKAQERKATIDEEMRQKIENLRTMFTIVCFENLETVIKNDSGEEIEGSRKVKSHLFIEDGNTVCLFIRHGTKSNISRNVKLCELIYKHLDGALNSVHFLHVQNLMMIKQAVKIPDLLDEMGIRRDVQQLASGLFEANPGAVIPPEEHYLLMMYEEFIFRPDEIVGYKEEDDDLESEQGKYIYARIIEKTSPPSHEKKEEKRLKKLKKKRKKEIEKKRIAARMENSGSSKKNQQKENPLVGWYLIDIGTGTPVVAEVLDLYKLKRPQEVDDASMEENTFLYDQNNFPFNEGEEQPPSTSAAKPRTWGKIKKEICQALADIMSLPKEKQHKAVKRLYLRWHPDKNPKEMEELANKAMKFIQDEFKRLSSGEGVSGDGLGGASSASSSNQDWYDTFYANLNRRAQQQRSTYDNFRHQRNSFRSRSSRGASFGQSSEFHTPDASMARIWISQSRADLRSVDRLFEANDKLYWLICFQCSQVVEKALKGAMYAVCGLTDDQLMSHDLIWLASELRNSPNGPDVLYLSGELRNHHVPTRYPSKQPLVRAPKDVFTLEQAKKAREVARNVLQILEEFIGILDI